jgi:cytidylate kinase
MYRAVALAGLRHGVDWSWPDELADLAGRLDLRVSGQRIYLAGEDVTEEVRSSDVTAVTRYAADNARVRRQLVLLQRAAATGTDIVTEGRDQGTLVFPDAACKIFLTASAAERARRRLADLQSRGEAATPEQVLRAQEQRDREDAARPLGALVCAADAVEVSTDGLSIDHVVDRLESLVRARQGGRCTAPTPEG